MSPIAASDRELRTGAEVLEADLADWRQLLRTLNARFTTRDFASALELVNAIGAAAEEADHHPDLDLRWGSVGVRLSSHDVGGLTDRDLRLARTISALAAARGAEPHPEHVATLELALDTADLSEVRPFWSALLGGKVNAEVPDEVVDPRGVLPTVWFQGTEPHEAPRQRFHLDLHLPHDVAEQRIAAAVAAGGALVDAEAAPSFWVLADAQGNRACVCTWQGRG